MKTFLLPVVIGASAALLLVAGLRYYNDARATSVTVRPAPEFTQTDPDAWLGSEPLTMADLRGKVVLIDFWAFGCWNCYRSFPWLNALEDKYSDSPFQVIGIHTPEFEREKVKARVEEKIQEFGLEHPSMMDNDFAFWKRMGNRYWPTYYLIDKRGYIRYMFIGETHAGTPRAEAVESALKEVSRRRVARFLRVPEAVHDSSRHERGLVDVVPKTTVVRRLVLDEVADPAAHALLDLRALGLG